MVLQDVSFTIKQGEIIALVGPSGSGKSTLVDLLPRFYDVTGGSIRLDGRDLRDVSIDSLRSLIGVVTQETILFNDSVRNNIAYGQPEVSQHQLEEAARAANAHDFIARLPQGYDTTIGDRGVKLSGGERQRLSLARAILKNPPILILDEATSSLDTESELLVQEAIEHLMKGRTSIVIAHRLSTVQHADKIVVIEGGRVRETGQHAELLQEGGSLYKRLYDLQFRL
jgi:subfamily B ATP-binding cassette protein MsbA